MKVTATSFTCYDSLITSSQVEHKTERYKTRNFSNHRCNHLVKISEKIKQAANGLSRHPGQVLKDYAFNYGKDATVKFINFSVPKNN